MNPTAITNNNTHCVADAPEACAPTIEPKLAQLLEFTQKSQSTITPKEINAHLEQVLHNYDALTATYARNNERLDAELALIRHTGDTTAGQLQQRMDAVDSRVETLDSEVQQDIVLLDTRIATVHSLLQTQESILQEQVARLDQFGVAQELLDTATRGNRNRIEAVRDWAESQHAVVKAHIDGLRALQREHYSQFQAVQGMVHHLRAETLRLHQAQVQTALQLDRHTAHTRRRFQWTHIALASAVLLSAAGLAAFKWSPAFAPVATQQAVAQLDVRVNDVRREVRDLANLQTVVVEQDAKTAKLSTQLAQLESKLSTVGQAVNTLRAAQIQTTLNAATGLPVRDAQWLLQQSPTGFTIQLLAANDPAALRSFIARHATELGNAGLAYALTQRDGRERYNLFYGTFANATQARTALAALAPDLKTQQPWVRAMGSVHKALE